MMLKIQLWLKEIDILKYGENRTPLLKVSQYYSSFCISDQNKCRLDDFFGNIKNSNVSKLLTVNKKKIYTFKMKCINK